MSYVYIQSEPGLWTVGHYDGGKWEPESDHDSTDAAANRAAKLNGGGGADEDLRDLLREAVQYLDGHGGGAGRLAERIRDALA